MLPIHHPIFNHIDWTVQNYYNILYNKYLVDLGLSIAPAYVIPLKLEPNVLIPAINNKVYSPRFFIYVVEMSV